MSLAEIPVVLRLGLESAGVSMTAEEFDSITDYDESHFYEVIHGGARRVAIRC
jgi:hypothetical protein